MRATRFIVSVSWPLACGLALLAGSGCGATGTSMRVRTDRGPTADFSRYATYAWISPPLGARSEARHGGDVWGSVPTEAERDTIALDRDVRRAIDDQLARRGYVQVASPDADLLVDYRVGVRRKELNDRMGEYSRYRAEGGTGGWGDVWMGGYREGELSVLVADARTRSWVWQGTATAVANPSLRAKRLPKAAARIFEGFPARSRTPQ